MRHRALGLVLLAVLSPLVSVAQTDYSLRIRSLDVSLAGLVDDYLTDVYLNPARLSGLERSMVYAGKLPGEYVASPFPTPQQASRYSMTWIENEYYDSYSTGTPIVLSWLGALASSAALSVGAMFSETSSEDWYNDMGTSLTTDHVSVSSGGNGSSIENRRYVGDVRIAPLASGRALGAVLRASYETHNYDRAWISDDYEWRIDDPVNARRVYNSDVYRRSYEVVTGQLAAGYSDPAGLLSDAVVGAVYARENGTGYSVSAGLVDDDADRNGVGYGGGGVNVEHNAGSYDVDRDYSGFGGFARIHFNWTGTVRSTHAASWTRSNGDGAAGVQSEDIDDFTYLSGELDYAYDGVVDRTYVQSSVGYHETFFDDVLVAFGVQARYARTEFREDATGDFNVTASDFDGTMTSPYSQSHDDVTEIYSLVLPAAFEWPFHEYVTLRIGAALFASHEETKIELTANIEDFPGGGFPDLVTGASYEAGDVDASVRSRLNTGLEFNFKNRFIVDLAGYVDSGSIELASFSYLSARFTF